MPRCTRCGTHVLAHPEAIRSRPSVFGPCEQDAAGGPHVFQLNALELSTASVKKPSRSSGKAKIATVTRLPTQHPRSPHCTVCGVPLPSFTGLELSFSPSGLEGHTVTGIVLKITCKCGKKWTAEKIVPKTR